MSEINTLRKNDENVIGFYLITSLEEKTTKNGKPYLDLTLSDKTGSINAKLWDYDKTKHFFRKGDIIKVKGKIQEFGGKLQYIIERIRKSEPRDNIDKSAFIKTSERDFNEMSAELDAVINSIKNPYLNKLLRIIFSGEKLEKFKNLPAGKAWHHAYVHGLLEHTLEIVKICELIASFHREINRDLLVAGALLHDFGKTEELAGESDFVYTDKGKLIGHIVIAAIVVEKAAEKIDGFPEDLKMQLEHLVLSHQGKLEFASPVIPKTVEAIALYHADELSAKTNAYIHAINSDSNNESDWTNFIRLAETDLYKTNNKNRGE
jgi:3'-5' exoribonuclease